MPRKSFRVLRLYKMPASRQIVSDKANTSAHTHTRTDMHMRAGSKCVCEVSKKTKQSVNDDNKQGTSATGKQARPNQIILYTIRMH